MSEDQKALKFNIMDSNILLKNSLIYSFFWKKITFVSVDRDRQKIIKFCCVPERKVWKANTKQAAHFVVSFIILYFRCLCDYNILKYQYKFISCLF